jgi:23S rRNA pseudouridine1911/1915/1917 synthase
MLISVDKNLDGKTVKQFLFGELKLTRAQVTALKLDPLGILYNGSHATVRQVLHEGDTLEIALYDRKEDVNEDIVPVPLPFGIVYEDDCMLVADKPFGMPVHPSYNHRDDSLANAIAYYYEKNGIVAAFRAVNRLDRDTSGLVIIAKNRMTANRLCKSMESGEIKKEYIALLSGRLDGSVGEENKIESYIKREQESIITRISCQQGIDSEYALTRYSVIGYDEKNNLTAVKASPVTGRTHQLRVHFSSLGHYIIGDTLYGEKAPLKSLIERQALHAFSLELKHPYSNLTMKFKAEIPKDIKNAMSEECLKNVEKSCFEN